MRNRKEKIDKDKEKVRLSSLAESNPDAIYAFHEEKGVQYVNPAFEKLTGYSFEEICNDGFNLLEIIHPEDVELIERILAARGKEEEIPGKYEFRLLTRDDSVKTVKATNVPLPERREFTVSILRDITRDISRARLLDAFNQSAVEIEKSLTPESMFNSVSRRLKELGFDSVVYLPSEDDSGLIPRYVSFESNILKGIEKLTGLSREEYAIPNDGSTPHGQAVRNKETRFIENVIEGFNAILPERYEKFAGKVADLLHLPKNEIAAPIIVEDDVIGIFSLLANDLSPKDKTTVTAFSRILAAGFHKTRLLEKTQQEIKKRKRAQKRLEESERDLKKSFIELAETTSRVLGVRDPYTQKHEQAVAQLARKVGKRMGLDEERRLGLYLGGVLHDIGKIAIPETILTKPGQLKEVEWNMIKSHPEVGFEQILEGTDFPWPVARMTLHHHERLDGSGYPHGLEGDEISLEVRIIGAVDVVEAMSSRRPYRSAKSKDEVIKEIRKGSGVKYDPEVIEVILDLIEEDEIEFG